MATEENKDLGGVDPAYREQMARFRATTDDLNAAMAGPAYGITQIDGKPATSLRFERSEKDGQPSYTVSFHMGNKQVARLKDLDGDTLADANPYLVMAAIFAGILHGLDNELPLQEEVEGNGLEQEGLPFPIRQSDALGEFIENDHLRRYLGERFCHVYHACKNDELLQFERLITETEIEWMLKNA